jgi:hypothetical protein
MLIRLQTRRITNWLTAGIVLIAALGVIAEMLALRYTHGYVHRLVNLVSLDTEWNIATWYATLLLLFSAILLGLIAVSTRRRGEPFVRHWRVLAFGFAYLCLDEAVGLHETINPLVRPLVEPLTFGDRIQFPWVIPAAVVVAVVFVAYVPFLRHLPSPVARRFVLAGALYVGGAVGVETLCGVIAADAGTVNLPYQLLAAFEEVLEMSGVVVFIAALLRHLASKEREIEVRLCGPQR